MSLNTVQTPNVLIVEDEMMLRMRAVNIVEDAGFNPVEAVNADEAIAILETRSDISLLFTDIQMPGSMDGLKLAHAVHDRWPDIKIILVSGQVKPTDAEKPTDARFFGKPLSSEKMVLQLQSMVGFGHLKPPPNAAIQNISEDPQSVPANSTLLRSPQEVLLLAENDSLRLMLDQANIDAESLLANAGIEAKEREAADKLQQLIIGELHHRIKNTLATVGAIASQSFRGAASIEDGQFAMEGRLVALGRVHDLLMQSSWSNADLIHTLKAATEPFDSRDVARFHFIGADIKIKSDAVIALAMTCNELCTNAAKFGALSTPAGCVNISWKVDGDNKRIHFSWTEKGGPPAQPPLRQGFGTRMMRSLGQQLKGEVDFSYGTSGFAYALDVPLASIAS